MKLKSARSTAQIFSSHVDVQKYRGEELEKIIFSIFFFFLVQNSSIDLCVLC